MFFKENLKLKINSINDLSRCITLSSLLELSGWPKPGNVHRTRDLENTRFEHFLAGIAAIQPSFYSLCKRTHDKLNKSNQDYSFIKLGSFFIEAAKGMMNSQRGGNVLLGHILILAPLASAAAICLKLKIRDFKDFSLMIKKIINDSTVEDTIGLYEAIRACSPGGLGKVKNYDINNNKSIRNIKKDGINLKRIFDLSKDRDSISLEYSTGYNIILNEGLPFYLHKFDETRDVNISTVETYLKILADHPDTLIIRKLGNDAALEVSREALKILKKGGISTKEGYKLALELDNHLQTFEGKKNPGTTADLLAGIIFCALILGLIF